MSAGEFLATDGVDASHGLDARQRRRKRTKHGRYVADITYEELSRCFNMPALQACSELGIGLTMVKRLSRKYGIKRWPFRKNRAERRVARGDERQDANISSDLDGTAGMSESSFPSTDGCPSDSQGLDPMPGPGLSGPHSSGPHSSGPSWPHSPSAVPFSHVNYYAAAALAPSSDPHPALTVPGLEGVLMDSMARMQGAAPVRPLHPTHPGYAGQLDSPLAPPPRQPAPDLAVSMLTELSQSHPDLIRQLVSALAGRPYLDTATAAAVPRPPPRLASLVSRGAVEAPVRLMSMQSTSLATLHARVEAAPMHPSAGARVVHPVALGGWRSAFTAVTH